MFRATDSPILRRLFDCIYRLWYNAPILLLTGATVEMERQLHIRFGNARQECRCIVPKSVYTDKECS